MPAAAAAEPEVTRNVNLDKLTMLKKLDSDSDDEVSYKVRYVNEHFCLPSFEHIFLSYSELLSAVHLTL